MSKHNCCENANEYLVKDIIGYYFSVSAQGLLYDEVDILYCPFCGEKLEVGELNE